MVQPLPLNESMPNKKVKQRIKELDKKIKELKEEFRKMEIRPCMGDRDLREREVDLKRLKEKIHATENERASLIYTWWDKAR